MSLFTSDIVVDNEVLVDGSAHTQPVSGTFFQATQPVSGTFFQATQPISGTVTANAGTGTMLVDGSAHTQPISGTVTTTPSVSSTSTVTQVTSTGSNQTLLATNASRKRAIIFFESGIWHVKFGTTASASSKTYMVTAANTTIEIPTWIGQIDALCTTSGKLADVTEMV